MAQFTVNAKRFDPYKNFKFRVRWDGRDVAGLSKVGALKRTTEVVEHREGGDPSTSRKSPGRSKFEPITWDAALDKIARAMKDDRDANFITHNDAGVPVNRWTTTGFLMCSSSSNESSYITVKVARGLGMVGIDTQARV